MSRRYEIPGAPLLVLDFLLLDVNGTLTDRGELIDGVAERLQLLAADLPITLLSSDTRGTLDGLGQFLGLEAVRVARGEEKRAIVAERGAQRCAAIGNGANDAPMLAAAALGIAVVGPEGAGSAAVRAADVVCASILAALDLLLDPRVLASTLRP